MESKTIVFDGNNGGQSNNQFDPNLLWAMMFGGGGFGGYGGGNWIWPLFLLALWGGNGFGGFGGGNGMFGGRGIGFLSDQINNNYGRDLLAQLINGNKDAIGQLSNMLGCKVGDIQNALNALQNQICQFSNQTGIGQQQIINSLERGDANLASQLAACCCDLKGAIKDVAIGQERGFSSIAFNQERNKCDIEKAIADQTQTITARLDAMEKTALLEKIDKLREDKSTLTTQLNLEHQNQYTAGVVAQAVGPVNAALAALRSDVDGIKCKLPETYSVPFQPFTAIPNCVAYGIGLNGFGLGWNNNNGFF